MILAIAAVGKNIKRVTVKPIESNLTPALQTGGLNCESRYIYLLLLGAYSAIDSRQTTMLSSKSAPVRRG
jgi:hypothetical protein